MHTILRTVVVPHFVHWTPLIHDNFNLFARAKLSGPIETKDYLNCPEASLSGPLRSVIQPAPTHQLRRTNAPHSSPNYLPASQLSQRLDSSHWYVPDGRERRALLCNAFRY